MIQLRFHQAGYQMISTGKSTHNMTENDSHWLIKHGAVIYSSVCVIRCPRWWLFNSLFAFIRIDFWRILCVETHEATALQKRVTVWSFAMKRSAVTHDSLRMTQRGICDPRTLSVGTVSRSEISPVSRRNSQIVFMAPSLLFIWQQTEVNIWVLFWNGSTRTAITFCKNNPGPLKMYCGAFFILWP